LNASRCVTLFECERTQKKQISFETDIGVIEGLQTRDGVSVQIPLRKNSGRFQFVPFNGKKTRGYFVNSGVPHFLIEQKNISKEKLKEPARSLRNNAVFRPHGTNVTFWQKKNSKIVAVTYERGVEDFTLACGTGAAAVGLFFTKEKKKNKTVIEMPGGTLHVQVLKDKIAVRGPAQKIYGAQVLLKEIL
jgi:diaminopimelate epimerase